MKDDYLWDGSGEPDADIKGLEDRLRPFKFRDRTFEIKSKPVRPSFNWAAAAAMVGIGVLSGVLWFLFHHPAPTTNNGAVAQAPVAPSPAPDQKETRPQTNATPERQGAIARSAATDSTIKDRARGRVAVAPLHVGLRAAPQRVVSAGGSGSNFAVAPQRVANSPLVDVDTERYIKGAQTLLLSFKNAAPSDPDVFAYVSEDRERSRALLARNVLLRHRAEQNGNIPMGELLESLEPFLLDIAHLSDNPSADDLRAIQNRIKKDEIMVALQSYSSPILARAF